MRCGPRVVVPQRARPNRGEGPDVQQTEAAGPRACPEDPELGLRRPALSLTRRFGCSRGSFPQCRLGLEGQVTG
eukprot:11383511-Alexandrium_andersonii.AAC.1